MARSTEIVDTIIQALEKITLANGYHTNAGLRVVRGRPEKLEINQDNLPMIAVSSPANTNGAVKPRQVIKEREVSVIGMVFADNRDYEPDLDDLDEDISLALAPLTAMDAMPGIFNVDLAGGEYGHPDGGSNLADVSHTVTARYVLVNKTNHED